MKPALRRDGVLAAGALGTLVGLAVITVGFEVFLRPFPVLIGFVGALLLEALFLRYPERTRALWERPSIQASGVMLVITVGFVTIWSGLDWVVAVLAWGLVAYLGLLSVIAVGYENPVMLLVK